MTRFNARRGSRTNGYAIAGGILVIALALTLGGWFQVTVWNECRTSGHGILYCLMLVSH